MANVFYEKDADPNLIGGRKVAVIGYGSQGHAHALNLKDSGVDVRVGLREGSSSKAKAEAAGLRVVPIGQAVAEADLIMILLPDTEQKGVYESDIESNLEDGDALFFAHGFNIRFGQIRPPAGVDVGMVAPKGPGHLVRREYEAGGGVPSLIAAAQDPSGKTMDLALSYAHAIGATRAGVLQTTFDEETKAEMRRILDEIQDGRFAEEWIAENQNGRPNFHEYRRKTQEHQIEKVGAELRAMMPWISAGKKGLQEASGGAGEKLLLQLN